MSRPVSRKKSCAPCRISKARCSLESPCRRCEERNLDCKYDHIPRRSAAYRALRPLPAVGEDIPEDLEQPSPHVGRLAHNGSTSAGSSMEDQLDHFSGTPMNWDALLSPSFLHFSLGCELDLPNLPSPSSAMRLNTLQGSQALPEPSGLPWLRNGQQPDVPDDQRALLSLGGSDSLPSARASHLHAQRKECQPRPPHPFYQDRPLTPRRNKGVASCFTVKVLLGQLLAYPKMMAKGGRLPPFIFPPCGVEGQNLPADSCGKEFHKCLPETLAICCNLVQSFETRTTGSASFVWKSIYKEVERLQQEYTSYDCEGLLQALQAILIYLLLQAGDPDSIPDNDVTTLLSAPDSIARALHVSCNYTINLTSSTKIDRREWVIRESVRRTICIIFGVELLLDVDFNVAGTECGGYSHLPLPSGRELWENVSNDEWAARYSRLHAQYSNERVLSIQDLRQARRAIGVETTDMSEDGRLVAQVAKWCEGLDELGMMVWMAVMLES